ncbi:MAG: hypothetical protein HQL37_06205 [Alphaproteobacteria bacterium]|nr:hypothetical protein [Alphaproteobacteria bacterium]
MTDDDLAVAAVVAQEGKMEGRYKIQLYSAFDGRTVGDPQIFSMPADSLAEYLTKCVEGGYEAVVEYPEEEDEEVSTSWKKSMAGCTYTHEERLRKIGHAAYVAELAQTLTKH